MPIIYDSKREYGGESGEGRESGHWLLGLLILDSITKQAADGEHVASQHASGLFGSLALGFQAEILHLSAVSERLIGQSWSTATRCLPISSLCRVIARDVSP